jgi:hypothetical protein
MFFDLNIKFLVSKLDFKLGIELINLFLTIRYKLKNAFNK